MQSSFKLQFDPRANLEKMTVTKASSIAGCFAVLTENLNYGVGLDNLPASCGKMSQGLVQEKSEALEEIVCTSCPKCGNKGAFGKLSQSGRGGRAYVRLTACLFLAAITAAKKRLKQGLSIHLHL